MLLESAFGRNAPTTDITKTPESQGRADSYPKQSTALDPQYESPNVSMPCIRTLITKSTIAAISSNKNHIVCLSFHRLGAYWRRAPTFCLWSAEVSSSPKAEDKLRIPSVLVLWQPSRLGSGCTVGRSGGASTSEVLVVLDCMSVYVRMDGWMDGCMDVWLCMDTYHVKAHISRLCVYLSALALRVGKNYNIAALIIAYTILGVPYYNYSIIGPKTLF